MSISNIRKKDKEKEKKKEGGWKNQLLKWLTYTTSTARCKMTYNSKVPTIQISTGMCGTPAGKIASHESSQPKPADSSASFY